MIRLCDWSEFQWLIYASSSAIRKSFQPMALFTKPNFSNPQGCLRPQTSVPLNNFPTSNFVPSPFPPPCNGTFKFVTAAFGPLGGHKLGVPPMSLQAPPPAAPPSLPGSCQPHAPPVNLFAQSRCPGAIQAFRIAFGKYWFRAGQLNPRESKSPCR